MERTLCPDCEKSFRKQTGLAWHLERTHHTTHEDLAGDSEAATDGGPTEIETLQARAESLEENVDQLQELFESVKSLGGLRSQADGMQERLDDLHALVNTQLQEQALKVQALECQLAEARELGLKNQRSIIAVATYLKEEVLPPIAAHSHEQMVTVYRDQEAIDNLPKCSFCGQPKDHGRRTCGEFECLAKVLAISQSKPDLEERRQDPLAGNDQGPRGAGRSLMDLVAS